MRRLAKRVLEAELPESLDGRILQFRNLYYFFVFLFLIAASLFSFQAFIGVEEAELVRIWNDASSNGWFQLYFVLAAGALLLRTVITILGYFWHKRTFGHEVSPRYVVFMSASFWLFQITFALSVIAVGALIALASNAMLSGNGSDQADWSMPEIQGSIDGFVASVPTIVSLPYLAAFVLVYLTSSFFGYWAHRLPHESRLLWLTAHRPHHISTTLTHATVMEADPAFALGLINRLAFGFLAGVSAKLVYSDSMIYEFMALGLIKNFTEVFNHSSVFYERMTALWLRFPPLKWLCHFSGAGPYHYYHHSSREGEEVLNIGGDPFLIWDHVFGTFKDPTRGKPPIGLTNQPEIYLNPIAHVFSGVLQIAYELVHNRSFKTRLKIIFGSVHYAPPHSRDFLKKPPQLQTGKPSLPHIPSEMAETG